MELLEAIYTRRSIRQYRPEPVSAEAVRTLLGAAMMAPSAGNVQPWQFVVVTDPEKMNQVKDIHPYVGMAAAQSWTQKPGNFSRLKSPQTRIPRGAWAAMPTYG